MVNKLPQAMVGELSEDGKWMWTGTEWIPAPPSSNQSSNVNLHDSVVAGDVNIIQNDLNSDAISRGFKDAMVSIKNKEIDQKRLQQLRDVTILEHLSITPSDYEELVHKLSNIRHLNSPCLNIYVNNICMIQIARQDSELPYMINIALEGTNLSPISLNHLNFRLNTDYNALEKYFNHSHNTMNELISDIQQIHEMMRLSEIGRLSADYFDLS